MTLRRIQVGEPASDYVILMAESTAAAPNAWAPRGGALLAAQPRSELNSRGPSFPFVLPRDDGPWWLI